MIERIKTRRWHVLLSMLFVMVGTAGFFALAGIVVQGSAQGLDDWGIRDLRRADDPAVPIGPRWLTVAAQDVTTLGGAAALFFVTAAVVGFLAFNRNFIALGFALASVVSGSCGIFCLKAFFERPRPRLVPPLDAVESFSFPSGHAMMSAVVYFTAAILLAQMTRRTRLRIFLLSTAALLTGLIGTSRVFLGIHYPTDVLAGWTAGTVWVSLCWLLARRFDCTRKRELRADNPALPSVRA